MNAMTNLTYFEHQLDWEGLLRAGAITQDQHDDYTRELRMELQELTTGREAAA